MPRLIYAAVVLSLCAAHSGCAISHTPPANTALALAPQSSGRYQCGPSTLASVLAFQGDPVPERDIAGAIYSPTARGTLLSDMAWYARQRGFDARISEGALEDLRKAVDAKHPPIVLLDLGFAGITKPHFTAVTGFAQDGVLQLGKSGAGEYVSLDRFTQQWNRAGHMLLVISR